MIISVVISADLLIHHRAPNGPIEVHIRMVLTQIIFEESDLRLSPSGRRK